MSTRRRGPRHRSSRVDCQRAAQLLGAHLKYLRTREGLTQSEVALKTGMHRPIVARMEAGRYLPSLDGLLRYADAIGVRVTEIVFILDLEPCFIGTETVEAAE